MKKIILFILFAITVSECFSKGEVIVVGENNVIPGTALQVTLKIRKDIIKKGPYARYAQQYLGVVAPLNDKTTYSIESGVIDVLNSSITSLNGVDPDINLEFLDMGSMPIVFSSEELTVNRVGAKVKSLKDMAMDAANTIFTIRKRRLDLITGESQDGFGEGLRAAIDEMSRLEKEYVELFVGKKIVSYSTQVFGVVPKSNIFNYVLCRFSDKIGVLDILSSKGEQIMLILAPENSVNIVNIPVKDKKKYIEMTYATPDWVNCSIMHEGKVVSSSMVEMYQYGKLLSPTKKK